MLDGPAQGTFTKGGHEMEVGKKSFLYKTAYGFNYYEPTAKSLCVFFWKFVFMFFLGWPLITALRAILFVVGFFFGCRPRFSNIDELYNNVAERYDKWPHIKGFRILPIYLVIALGIIILYVFSGPFRGFIVGTIIGVVLSVVIIGVFSRKNSSFFVKEIKKLKENSAVRLCIEYVKAKKQKVCPIINFKE